MSKKTEIEAAIFNRLINHLKNEPEIQNIDLMNLAGFCRNCLSKWYVEEASALGESINEETAKNWSMGWTMVNGKQNIKNLLLKSN